MPRVLFLPGMIGAGDRKSDALTEAGFEVQVVDFDDSTCAKLNEILKSPFRNFVSMASLLLKARRIYDKWVSAAQAAYDCFHPDIVVGSSRGGSVAMTMKVDDVIPIVLLAPAYRWFRWLGGNTSTNHPNVTVIHSRQDKQIPFSDSEKLCRRCPQVKLIVAGIDHSLLSPDATHVWIPEVDQLARKSCLKRCGILE